MLWRNRGRLFLKMSREVEVRSLQILGALEVGGHSHERLLKSFRGPVSLGLVKLQWWYFSCLFRRACIWRVGLDMERIVLKMVDWLF